MAAGNPEVVDQSTSTENDRAEDLRAVRGVAALHSLSARNWSDISYRLSTSVLFRAQARCSLDRIEELRCQQLVLLHATERGEQFEVIQMLKKAGAKE
jgi:hypothetical protein